MWIDNYCWPKWLFFRGISIVIISNNRVAAAATIAYCATDMIVKAYVDNYLGHELVLK